jgi:hypothetical protein
VVDSLVLHSGYSSLRLENFLFTREAFEDVKRSLKPGGLFVMYNYYRQGWVVARLARMAEEVFGTKPLVLSLPHRASIRAEDNEPGFTWVIVGPDAARLDAIRARFAQTGSFWLFGEPAKSVALDGFRAAAPGEHWIRIAPVQVDGAQAEPVPSDDWPQLYLRSREIPWAPIGQGMLAVALLSAALLAAFAPRVRAAPNWQMFFLGAGFMLLETKGVVHMALLFGSTWVVNSAVFAAILAMILAANLYVLKMRPRNLLPYYALLAAALVVNLAVPLNTYLSLAPFARTIVSCAVVFVPVFFAGVIFATLFRDSREPDVDFGWNVAGVVAGGLSEHLSLVLGFNYLLIVAAAYYLAAFALRPRAARPA